LDRKIGFIGLAGSIGMAFFVDLQDLQVLFPVLKTISVLAALAVPNGFAGTCNPSHAQRKL